MNKIIAAGMVVIGLVIACSPPAEANIVSDTASSTWNNGKDIATHALHVIGDTVKTAITFIKKVSHKIVMVAVDHPVYVGLAILLITATVVFPPLLSVDGEILATAMAVESTEVIASDVIATEAIASEIIGAEVIAPEVIAPEVATAQLEAAAEVLETDEGLVGLSEEEGSCYVKGCSNSRAVPKETRDPRRVLNTAERREVLERAGCFTPAGCVSAQTGERFPLRNPETGTMNAHIDHIKAHSAGGATSVQNSQVLRSSENLIKSGPRVAA